MRLVTLSLILLFFTISIFAYSNTEFSSPSAATATENTSPRAVIESITSSLKKLIQKKPDAKSNELKNSISSIMNTAFDFDKLSEKTIHEKFWNKLSAQQKSKFKTLFSELLKKLYSKKTQDMLSKVDLEFSKEAIHGEHASVDYLIKRKDVDIEITYEMCKSPTSIGNPWKICNVKFDRADLARTYALQFNSKLEKSLIQKASVRQSFDKLLTQIDKKVKTI